MLRDPALVPLSHQHQHALALCVRITRANDNDVSALQQDIGELFQHEISFHFDVEEKVLFPAAKRFERLRPLLSDLLRDHTCLRAAATSAIAGGMKPAEIREFAGRLSAHIRREEQELFEGLQELLSRADLTELGAALDAAFRTSGMPGASCAFRSDST